MNDAYGKPCTKLSDGSSDSDSVLSVNIEDALPQSNNDINGKIVTANITVF